MEIWNGDYEFIDVRDVPNPEKHLVKSAEILEGYKWYFSFGTALGLYRDKGFIPGDTDIDINIITDNPKEIIDKFSKEYRLVRTIIYNGICQQAVFQAPDKLLIDLSFGYEDGEGYISRHEEANYFDEKDLLGDLKKLSTPFGEFPFPEKIEDYLVKRYGDWQTPRYGKTTSALAN